MFESSASSAPHEGLYGLPRGAARPRGLRAGADAFAESPYFAAVLLGTAAWFLLLNDSRGAVTAMALAFCTVMLFCRDVLCALLPLLLALLCTVDHYEDLRYFLDLWWLAAPVLLAVTVRLVRTPVRRAGRCRRGLLAVSAAVLLGGLGRLPLEQALSPLALYYTLGLSAGMLAVYRLARGSVSSGAEARARFADTLYAAGIFAAFLVLRLYCTQLHRFLRTGATLYFSYRNYCATMLLLALPVPFLRALEQPRHLMSAGVLYLALLLTGSRSGLLFGTVLLLLAAAGTAALGSGAAGALPPDFAALGHPGGGVHGIPGAGALLGALLPRPPDRGRRGPGQLPAPGAAGFSGQSPLRPGTRQPGERLRLLRRAREPCVLP